MSRFEAVLFDLDGTLVDSAADLCSATNEILKISGRRTIDVSDVRQMVGDGVPVLIERAFNLTGAPCPQEKLHDLTKTFVEIYDGNGAVDTVAYPGVVETLQALADDNIELAVCTNKPQEPTEGILEELNLSSFFRSVIGGDALPYRKPDGRHLEAVLKELGVEKNKALFVGDSPIDVAAGKNAKLPVIAVSYGYTRIPPPEMGADILIDSMPDLLPAMKNL